MKRFYSKILLRLLRHYNVESAKMMAARLTVVFPFLWDYGTIPETAKMIHNIEVCQCDFDIVRQCVDNLFEDAALKPYIKSDIL